MILRSVDRPDSLSLVFEFSLPSTIQLLRVLFLHCSSPERRTSLVILSLIFFTPLRLTRSKSLWKLTPAH